MKRRLFMGFLYVVECAACGFIWLHYGWRPFLLAIVSEALGMIRRGEKAARRQEALTEALVCACKMDERRAEKDNYAETCATCGEEFTEKNPCWNDDGFIFGTPTKHLNGQCKRCADRWEGSNRLRHGRIERRAGQHAEGEAE